MDDASGPPLRLLIWFCRGGKAERSGRWGMKSEEGGVLGMWRTITDYEKGNRVQVSRKGSPRYSAHGSASFNAIGT